MNIILFDTAARNKLFPLTLTRAVADLRMGILTIKERWEKMAGVKAFVLTDTYLQPLYEPIESGDCIFIDACVIPNPDLIKSIMSLETDEAIEDENGLIAGRAFTEALPSLNEVSSLFKKVSAVDP